MSSTRRFKERPLPIILVAGLIGMLLTVGGGLIAQERNIDQYAAQQVDHQIDWITNHPEPYDPAGETSLADWVADKVTRTGLDREDMVFSVNTAGEDVTKLGPGVPELAQSGLLLDADARAEILAPGEGRVGSDVGDFYHRTINVNVGSETVTLASLVYLGGFDQVQDQTRNSMILLGLGGWLILTLVAANLLGGKRVVDADRLVHDDDSHRERPDGDDRHKNDDRHNGNGRENDRRNEGRPKDDGPRRTSAIEAIFAKQERDDLADRSTFNTGDPSYDVDKLPSHEPTDEVAPTQHHDVAHTQDTADGGTRAEPAGVDAPTEVRASGVWSWSEEDDHDDPASR